jgi:hypothetical protein
VTLPRTKWSYLNKEQQFMKSSYHRTVKALIVGMACSLGSIAMAADANLTTWDADHDGTLDLAEAKAAAAAKFDSLDVDHDGTLDAKELAHAVHKSSFKRADSDSDGTLDKTEYSALVEARFKAADSDHDGTVSDAELSTKAGKALSRLL